MNELEKEVKYTDLYDLAFDDVDLGEYPFYVGKSKDGYLKRERDHRYAAHRVKDASPYTDERSKLIRELDEQGIKWRARLISTIVDDVYARDSEYIRVIEYVAAGYELTNMKMGDKAKQKELAAIINNISLGVTIDVVKDVLKKVRNEEKGKKKLSAEKLRLRIIKELKDKELQEAMNKARLIREAREKEKRELEKRAAREAEAKRVANLSEKERKLEHIKKYSFTDAQAYKYLKDFYFNELFSDECKSNFRNEEQWAEIILLIKKRMVNGVSRDTIRYKRYIEEIIAIYVDI